MAIMSLILVGLGMLEKCEELEREESLRLEEEAAFQIDGHDELTAEQREIWVRLGRRHCLSKSIDEEENCREPPYCS
ncbi:hypothetical protein BRADI_3g32120v3 [Brachypodium distachyon]|uniref:Uncharacterized protein n=1 Tax=Brachypodium distachyon TaxID=15368 RepID=I1I5Q5_BRADI|nr:hypothetical protein BRADI_3g32120v3 [Brachypodium distachyon]